MKTAFLLLALSLMLRAGAQPASLVPIDKVTKRINYAFRVAAPGKSQAELLAAAQAWATRLAAEPALGVVSQLQGNTLTLTVNQPLYYPCAGKLANNPLRFTARVCPGDGYFEYELTDFDFLLPHQGNTIREAEPYILSSFSEYPVAAQCIAKNIQAFTENATAFSTKLQNALLGKPAPTPTAPVESKPARRKKL